MIRLKGGFTLIEVSLFLAITGLLFLGVTIGVQNSIFQQRYNDSVQSFVEFLRNVYAEVENVQNTQNSGKSELAVFGRLVTFGEKTAPDGQANNNGSVYVYDVVGSADVRVGTSGVRQALAAIEANVVVEGEVGVAKPAGIVSSFVPKWGSGIQDVDFDEYVGALLVIRHPGSGMMYTYVMNGKTVEVGESIRNGYDKNLLKDYMSSPEGFKVRAADYCINPEGMDDKDNKTRVDVRVNAGARNSTGIDVIWEGSDSGTTTDYDNNVCRSYVGD